jgi:hypothetical protein
MILQHKHYRRGADEGKRYVFKAEHMIYIHLLSLAMLKKGLAEFIQTAVSRA